MKILHNIAFGSDKVCETKGKTDSEGNPVLDETGSQVMEEVCENVPKCDND